MTENSVVSRYSSPASAQNTEFAEKSRLQGTDDRPSVLAGTLGRRGAEAEGGGGKGSHPGFGSKLKSINRIVKAEEGSLLGL